MTGINTNYNHPHFITEQTKQRIIDGTEKTESPENGIGYKDIKDTLEISEDAINSYKANLEKSATSGLQHNEDGKGIIFTDFSILFGSRMPSIYGEKDENGEYTRHYFTKEEKQQNILKAYADIFSEIIAGYADGTRQTYVEDKNSEKGYRQLTMAEEIDALDKVFLEYTERQARNNGEVRGILADHARKVSQLSGGQSKIAFEVVELMEKNALDDNTIFANVSDEDKIRKAREFLAKHDALYAEQMATVMDTINDGMQVAIEVAKRMSSGAKVSDSDEKMLQEYNPQMYMAAKNAQQMAERKKDMSDESLIDDFVDRHKNDRKDWTSELNEDIAEMNGSSNNPVNTEG